MAQHFPPADPSRMPPLSMAVRTGNLLFISGLGPHEPDWTIASDFAAQLRAVLAMLDRVLAEAGASRRNLVKVNVLLTRASDVAEMNRIYAAWIGEPPYPARTTCVVTALPLPEFLLEIEAVAELA